MSLECEFEASSPFATRPSIEDLLTSFALDVWMAWVGYVRVR